MVTGEVASKSLPKQFSSLPLNQFSGESSGGSDFMDDAMEDDIPL